MSHEACAIVWHFSLGFVIFPCPTHLRHLLNVFKWVIWVMKAKCVFTGKDLGLKWWVRYTDKIWSLNVLKTICRRVDDSVASCRFATWVHGYGNRIISERTSVVRSCSWWPLRVIAGLGSWHSSLKRLNCFKRIAASCDSLFANIQFPPARSLEKVNFTV